MFYLPNHRAEIADLRVVLLQSARVIEINRYHRPGRDVIAIDKPGAQGQCAERNDPEPPRATRFFDGRFRQRLSGVGIFNAVIHSVSFPLANPKSIADQNSAWPAT